MHSYLSKLEKKIDAKLNENNFIFVNFPLENSSSFIIIYNWKKIKKFLDYFFKS